MKTQRKIIQHCGAISLRTDLNPSGAQLHGGVLREAADVST